MDRFLSSHYFSAIKMYLCCQEESRFVTSELLSNVIPLCFMPIYATYSPDAAKLSLSNFPSSFELFHQLSF